MHPKCFRHDVQSCGEFVYTDKLIYRIIQSNSILYEIVLFVSQHVFYPLILQSILHYDVITFNYASFSLYCFCLGETCTVTELRAFVRLFVRPKCKITLRDFVWCFCWKHNAWFVFIAGVCVYLSTTVFPPLRWWSFGKTFFLCFSNKMERSNYELKSRGINHIHFGYDQCFI